jgi:hypothetical protein
MNNIYDEEINVQQKTNKSLINLIKSNFYRGRFMIFHQSC